MAAEKTAETGILRELTAEEWARLQTWAVEYAANGGSFSIEGPSGYLICNRDGLHVMCLRDLL